MLKKNLFVLALLSLMAAIFWSSLAFQETFLAAVSGLEKYIQAHQVLGVAMFIGLGALSALLSPFSSIPLLPAATLIWGNALTFMYLLTGWLIGGIITYLIGHYLGHPAFQKFAAFQKIESYRKRLPEEVQFLLVFLLRLALPAEIPGYVLGIIRYNFFKYFLATVLAEIPFAFLAVNAGYAFSAKRPAVFLGSVLVGLFVLTLAFYLFQKYLPTSHAGQRRK